MATPRSPQRSAASRTTAFAIGERRVGEGRRTRFEVDVIGDRQLGDAPLEGGGGVDVDRDVAVWREVGMEVCVERQVARPGDPSSAPHPFGGTRVTPR